MKINQIYSNIPEKFECVKFKSGLNVILGKKITKKNKTDPHNVGKTTLCRLIDFCLAKRKDERFFLIKQSRLFKEFVFYLELEISNGIFLTVKRSVANATKLSFKIHHSSYTDFSGDSVEWDHEDIGFDKSKKIFDTYLNLTKISPYHFRSPVSYALRTQSDFTDVFQLSKHRGKHSDWKPYLSKVLGFRSELVTESFKSKSQIEELEIKVDILQENTSIEANLDEINGLIEIKKNEVQRLGIALQEIEIGINDDENQKKLFKDVEIKIASLNKRKYYLSKDIAKIEKSLLNKSIKFNPDSTESLFNEAGIIFSDQIKRTFDELVSFNKAVSSERIKFLKRELQELQSESQKVVEELDVLNQKRTNTLKLLGAVDSMVQIQDMNNKFIDKKNELNILEGRKSAVETIQSYHKDLRKLKFERDEIVDQISKDIIEKSSSSQFRYNRIKNGFNKIVRNFVGRGALLSTNVNKEGNIEFSAKYLDEDSMETNEQDGKSYKQILCAAFDLTILDEYKNENFIKFIYHDGLLEGLHDSIKLSIIEEIRSKSTHGIQQILTVLDSDLPQLEDGSTFQFEKSEVRLTLHDDGNDGKLFKMQGW